LGELARRYRRFVDSFAAAATVSAAALSPESAFVIRTLLIHEYRKIHLRDPLLPPALLPNDWVGASAYELCARLYAKIFAAAEEFLTGTASTLEQALPPADASAYARFGGILRSIRSCRLSITRFALPAERSRDPGLATLIRAVTPILSLMLYCSC